MKIQANQLTSHLKSNLASCYLISGDEHLLVDEALDAVRAAAKNRGFLSRDLHVATAGFDWNQLFQSGANMSLFAEKRLIELRLPTGKPGRSGGQAIVDLLGQLDDELMLVVIAPKLDRSTQNTNWVKSLDAAGVSMPVWPVEARDLPGWISARGRAAGLQLDTEAVRMIAGRVEGNLLAAAQEIEKLRLLLGEGQISAEQVSGAVADSSRFDVFKLADAALAGRSDRAARILYGLQHEGTSIVIVIWSLAKEIRTLFSLAEAVRRREDLGSAMRKHGVWQQRQALLRHALGRHSTDSLGALLVDAARADAAAKGQRRADPWQLAMNLVFGLASEHRKAA
ncbi:MAG: DNA polymerase III subunit delta [Pseudomonadota bacterium]